MGEERQQSKAPWSTSNGMDCPRQGAERLSSRTQRRVRDARISQGVEGSIKVKDREESWESCLYFPSLLQNIPPLHWGLWMSDPIAGIVTGRTTNRQWQNAASSSGKREAKERCLTGCVRCRLGEAGCEAGAVHRLRIPSAGQP